MKTTTWVALASMTLAASVARPALAQDATETAIQIAAQIEGIALTLHDRADRWGEAAVLYGTAAELRADDDPKAQKDLFTAAQLYLETGSVGRSIQALETAGSRALAVGDSRTARERFADAALVAQRAGLTRDHQRLSYRAAEIAMATELDRIAVGTPVEEASAP